MTISIRVLLDLSRMTASVLVSWANAVYAGLYLNPAYPNPPVPLPDFRNAIDDFAAAVVAALDGGSKAIAHRNDLGEKLGRMMRKLARYVEATCNDDMPAFLSSGFQPATNARSRQVPVSESIRKIDSGAASGEFLVALMKVPGAYSYELRWAPTVSGGVPGEWTIQPVAHTRPTSVKGFTPGVTYLFQARALTKSGLTDWSESVTRICT